MRQASHTFFKENHFMQILKFDNIVAINLNLLQVIEANYDSNKVSMIFDKRVFIPEKCRVFGREIGGYFPTSNYVKFHFLCEEDTKEFMESLSSIVSDKRGVIDFCEIEDAYENLIENSREVEGR